MPASKQVRKALLQACKENDQVNYHDFVSK